MARARREVNGCEVESVASALLALVGTCSPATVSFQADASGLEGDVPSSVVPALVNGAGS